MQRTIYKQWRDWTRAVLYPFVDDATLINNSGVVFPAGALLDLVLYPAGAGTVAYLSVVDVDDTGVTLTVSGEDSALCTASFARNARPTSLAFTDSLGRPAGVAVCDPGEMASVAAWAAGTYRFTASQASFAPSVLLPSPETGVRGFLVGDELFAGDVTFVAEDGVDFRVSDAGELIVDAVGDPLFMRADCTDLWDDDGSSLGGRFNDGPFLETLNGVAPNAQGDLCLYPSGELSPDTVFRVEPVANGLRLRLVATQALG